jgi:phosphatidylglycerophosphate synthase
MNKRVLQQLMTLPNLLTCFRFVAAPVLLWLAWFDYPVAFMSVLACSFLSDALDGFAARLTGQVSSLGAQLDSWADVIIYITIAISCWWLWPEIFIEELFSATVIILSCLLPTLSGLWKFGTFTSYHTVAVKLAAASTASSLFILFLDGSVWPFHLAALICAIAAVEEIAITLLSTKPQSNIRSLLDLF